jgi:hypothetical protein
MTDRTDFTQTFSVRVDGGPEQSITVNTGVYRDAAAAVPALLGYYLPVVVEIWCEHSDKGPFLFEVRQNKFVGLETCHLVRMPSIDGERGEESK